MVVEVDNIDTIKNGNVLVDFYTTTCGPCRALNPVLEEIDQEFDNVQVAKIEVTRNPAASQVFGVMTVPTVMFLQDSQVKEVSQGFSGKADLTSMIKRHLNGHGF
jgi:thioredoxin 1